MKIRCPKDETGASWFASEPSSILKEGSGIIKKLMPAGGIAEWSRVLATAE